MDYKTCNNCGKRVKADSNFCPYCKSTSFRTNEVIVSPKREIARPSEDNNIKRILFYWNYDGYYVLSKSKLAAITVFAVFFLTALTVSTPAVVYFFFVIVAFLIFLIGLCFHKLKADPSPMRLENNDYGLTTDLKYLLAYWQNKNTGEYVISKTKCFTLIIFFAFAILGAVSPVATFFSSFLIGMIFAVPAFLIGFAIHKLTNNNPTNPNWVPPERKPKEVEPVKHKIPKPKPEPVKAPEPVQLPKKFEGYKNRLENLKKTYRTKDAKAREMIEKRFAPPQITYTRFISTVDSSTAVFNQEADEISNLIELGDEDSKRIVEEIERKFGVLETIIGKMDDLINELVISLDSTNDGDVENLFDDMENLIGSIKDYE